MAKVVTLMLAVTVAKEDIEDMKKWLKDTLDHEAGPLCLWTMTEVQAADDVAEEYRETYDC